MPRRGRRPASASVTPYSLAVFIPPSWDRSYTECFGFTLEEIYTEGARSLRGRSCAPPGCRWSRCPGPSVFPLELSRARARRVRPGDAARRLPRPAPTARRRATRRRWQLLFNAVAPRRRPPHRARPARSPCSGSSPDAEPWHLRVDNGSTAAARRAARRTSTSRSAAATRTGSTSSPAAWTRAARSPPAGCARTARPRALWAARGLF